MARTITYRLHDANFTIYHRAALGGLASTIYAWQNTRPDAKPPDYIHCQFDDDTVTLEWDDRCTDVQAMETILQSAFRITKDGLIDLPGSGIGLDNKSLQVALHNAITGTFLQHAKMRPGPKETRQINIANADREEEAKWVAYKPIDTYAHQKAQGTDLLAAKNGRMPQFAKIPQSVVPGAMSGAVSLEASGEEAFLLLFLMVGCPLYIVRSSKQDAKTQYAILVPDINNLIDYAETIHLQGGSSQIHKQSHLRLSYANRIVGGAEEAAFRFLTDLKARQQIGTGLYGISDFVVIAMGKVAWDGNQMNRSCSYKVGTYYKEMDVYLAANSYDDLGGVREIPLKNGEVFMAPATPVPALVAANLAAGNHWCSGFAELVKEQKQFQIMKFKKEGFAAMKKSIRSEEDQAFIEVFHEAWFRTLGQIGERARREGLDYNRLVEVEQERVRNTILRMRSIHQLNTWFMRFCSASSLAPLNSLVEKGNIILRMFESPKNYERLQSLCLFALLSYESRNPSKKDNQPSDDKTNGNESSDNRSNA